MHDYVPKELGMAIEPPRSQLVALLPGVIFGMAILLFTLFGLNAWLWWN